MRGLPQKLLYLAAAAVLVVVIINDLRKNRPPPPPADGPVSQWMVRASPRFRAQFKYPPHWTRSSPREEDGYFGHNGFVIMSAFGGRGLTIDQAVGLEIKGKADLYGAKPSIEKSLIDGQEARIVMPSADQPADKRGQAMAMIRYPTPIRFSSEIYAFAILWADQEHLPTIAGTFRFSRPGS